LGTRGPIPKRTEERRRRNKEGGEVDKVVSKMPEGFQPKMAPAHWHELAKDWYESLKISGQSDFYEPSDWAQARVLGEMLNTILKSMNGQAFAAWLSGAADLLTSEGQRRRLRLELTKGGEEVDDSKGKIVTLYKTRAGLAKTG
jgi:hypothetical protein